MLSEGRSPLTWDHNRKDAIDNAAKTFQTWRKTPPAVKSAIFSKAARLILEDKYSQKITQFAVDETGSLASWAKIVNVDLGAPFLESACKMVYDVKGEILPSDSGAKSFVQKLPMGVMYVQNLHNA